MKLSITNFCELSFFNDQNLADCEIFARESTKYNVRTYARAEYNQNKSKKSHNPIFFFHLSPAFPIYLDKFSKGEGYDKLQLLETPGIVKKS
jgi:hypothetical protein